MRPGLRQMNIKGSAHEFYAAFELTHRLKNLDICIFSHMHSISSHGSVPVET